MNRDDWALQRAAEDHGVHLIKATADTWEVGLMPNLDPLVPGEPRQAETFLSGDRIRLPDGQVYPRSMTTAEARRLFGLEPL